MLKRSHILLYLCFMGMLALSCVDDVDFDQADDLVLTPQVDVDLIFLSLQTENFIDASIPDTTVVVQDTTRLEFLNDSFVRDNIKQIDLTFQVDNTFGQSFTNRAVFLNNNGVPQYGLEFTVDPSADGSVTRTTFVETVTQEELDAILSSIQLANELTLNTNGATIDGSIDLQSKALFSLEISDL